jgi:hypothetical protein
VQRQRTDHDLLQAVDAQAEVAARPQDDVRVEIEAGEDEGQGDRGHVQRPRPLQGVGHRGHESGAFCLAAVGLAHDEATDEDEALGSRDVEAVPAGDGVQPRVATEVVDDHGEDAEAA